MIGSRDYNDPEKIDGKYNIATALRQPGSSIKPIVYALAFENGLDPETYCV
jgi:membrane carboxypeptidase/penicillin-binding protein PbpC